MQRTRYVALPPAGSRSARPIAHRGSHRWLDLLLVVAAVPISLPLAAIAAAALRLDGPGSVLFRQQRLGFGGSTFTMLKLRTMSRGRSDGIAGAEASRIGPVGRFVRRWKLDELPQLLNVWRGEMTVFGPRPELPRHLPRLRQLGHPLWVLPGLVDTASIMFCDEERLLGRTVDPEHAYSEVILPVKTELSKRSLSRGPFRRHLQILTAVPALFSARIRDRDESRREALSRLPLRIPTTRAGVGRPPSRRTRSSTRPT